MIIPETEDSITQDEPIATSCCACIDKKTYVVFKYLSRFCYALFFAVAFVALLIQMNNTIGPRTFYFMICVFNIIIFSVMSVLNMCMLCRKKN